MNWTELEKRAFTPYSNEPKACVVKGKSGTYYPGVRVENISFPLSIPCIQAACSYCLAEGDTPELLILKDESDYEQLDFWKKELSLTIEVMESIETITFANPVKEIDPEETKEHLIELLDKAVIPNSDFPVSALLFLDETNVISGVNVEVSDWTKGLCAERVALVKALSHGFNEFDSMSVHTKKGEFSSPCGACRQVIHQHMPMHKMNLYHADGTQSYHFTNHLLPFSFTSNSLSK